MSLLAAGRDFMRATIFSGSPRGRRGGLALAIALVAIGAPAAFSAAPDDSAIGPTTVDPVVQQQIDEQEQEASAARAKRQTPEEIEARDRSATAYEGLSGDDAERLAETAFKETIQARSWSPPSLPEGMEVSSYIGLNQALVAPEDTTNGSLSVNSAGAPLGEGPESILQSTTPIRAPEQGSLRPLDPRLVEEGDHLEPSNSTVEAEIPNDLSDGIELPELNLKLDPQGADRAEPADLLAKDKVFYADVATDTDLIASPTQLGVETYLQLRSKRSPEQQNLAIDLPTGSELRPAFEGLGAAIIKDGVTTATVAPPLAFDADGSRVPVDLAINGSTLRLEIPHRSGDWKYPILVDPTLAQTYTWSSGGAPCPDNSSSTTPYWRWEASDRSKFQGTCSTFQALLNYSNANTSFGTNAYAEWVWQAPAFTYIQSATIGPQAFARSNGDGACTVDGIYRMQAPAAWESTPWVPCDSYNNQTRPPFTATNPSDANVLVDELLLPSAGPRTGGTYNITYGASMQVSDRYDPTITSVTNTPALSTQWSGDPEGTIYTAAVEANDRGSGIRYLNLVTPSKPANYYLMDRGCTGLDPKLSAGCTNPTSWSAPGGFHYDLPEGNNTVSVYAYDQFWQYNRTTPYSWQQRIDRTPPSVPADSGTLVTDSTRLNRDLSYTLTSKSTDGQLNAGDSAMRSGVTDLNVEINGSSSVLVNGVPTSYGVHSACPAAQGSCSLEKTWTIPGAAFHPGTNTVKVTATDAVGTPVASHTSSDPFTVTAYDPPDTAITTGPVTSTSDSTPAFGFTSTKPNSTFECKIDSQAWRTCTSPDTVTPSLSPGSHTYYVRASQPAGVTDQTPASRTFTYAPAQRATVVPGELGLEQYYQYDSLDTGLAGAHTNLATGNLVWHRVPLTNPGRGLSSVLNLTYNSYDYPATGDIPLDSRFLGLDYDEAGLGFSLGLSGVTRINEPLGGVLIPDVHGVGSGAVTMTDPDGTRHVFTPDNAHKSTGCVSGVATRYNAPPGVNLELRRYGCPDANIRDLVGKIGSPLNVDSPTDPQFADDFLGLDLDPTPQPTKLRDPKIWPAQGGTAARTLSQATGVGRDLTKADLFSLEKDNLWAITRPDGVTYYFNGFGFPTKTVDRDGNELRYVYDKVNPVGEPCTPAGDPPSPIIPGVCEPRLSKVIDAAGVDALKANANADVTSRTIKIDYYSLADLNVSSSSVDLSSLGSAVSSIRSQLGATPGNLNKLNKIKTVTDHQGRKLAFSYDSSGRLQSLTEAANTSSATSGAPPESSNVARSTDFSYDTPAVGDTLAHPQLASVSEPHGQGESGVGTTDFSYDANAPAREDLFQGGRPVSSVSDRDKSDGAHAAGPGQAPVDRTYGYVTNDDYSSGGEQTGPGAGEATQQTTVTDGRGTQTVVQLDRLDRPTAITEAANVPADARTTTIGWDADDFPSSGGGDNNVVQVTRAAGTNDAATTSFVYDNPNGMLSGQTEVVPQDPPGQQQHTTLLGYCHHPGTEPLVDAGDIANSAFGTDSTSNFVSDQTSMTNPRSNRWLYELDGHPRTGAQSESSYCASLQSGTILGHQTKQIDPAGHAATTSYDSHGEISVETDEVGDETHYRGYDASGMAQVIIDPEGYDLEGNESDPAAEKNRHTWLYQYDSVGNVLSVTDPRAVNDGSGSPTFPGLNGAFTTTLHYDSLNRMRTERIPRKSGPNGSNQAGDQFVRSDSSKLEGDQFIERSYDYDPTDNLTSEVDGEGKRTDIAYSPMDRPTLESTPSVPVSENGQSQPTVHRLETRYCYDGEEGLVRTLSPEATSAGKTCGSPSANHVTTSVLDSLGRPVASVQEHSDPSKDLITSYAYDHRDNRIAVKDPNSNADRTVAQAVTDARAATNLRMASTYDAADNLIRTVEDPGGLNIRTDYTYDADDNATSVVSPRGFTVGPVADFTSTRTYDSRDQLTDSVDPLGDKTHYAYDEAGRMISKTTPRGVATSGVNGDMTTTMTYDRNGDLHTRSVPWAKGQYGLSDVTLDQPKITYKRDSIGDPIQITDARGTVITNAFYDTGELGATSAPWWWKFDWSSPAADPQAGNRYVDASGGLRADFAIPQGGPTLSESGTYPSEGKAQMPSGPMAGDFGNAQAEDLPDFLPRAGGTKLTYDREGRMTSVTAADITDSPDSEPNSVRRINYDALGRVTTKSWSFGLDDAGAGPADITHDFTYDADSNLTGYIDGAGHKDNYTDSPVSEQMTSHGGSPLGASDYRTTFAYDAFDRRTAENAPGSLSSPSDASIEPETTSWSYDDNGNVLSRTTPRGPAFTFGFTYDEADRLKTETNPVSASYLYDYDADSNLTQATDPRNFLTSNHFDAADRLKGTTEADGTSVARTTAFTLDPEGNPTAILAPGAKPYEGAAGLADRLTQIDYDAMGQPWKTRGGLTPAGDDVGAMPREARTDVVQRDPMGNLVREVSGEGMAVNADDSNGSPGGFNSYADQAGLGDAAIKNATNRATVNVYDENGLRTASYLPHGDAPESDRTDHPTAYRANDPTRYALTFGYDDRGRLRYSDQAHGLDPSDKTTRVSYNYYDTDWIRSSSDARDVSVSDTNPSKDQTLRYSYDRRGIQTEWKTEGFRKENLNGRDIERTVNPSGTLFEKLGKQYVKPDADAQFQTTPDTDRRAYDYYYNPNRSLIQISDHVPNFDSPQGFDPDRQTLITRDGAERERKIHEDWRGGRDTVMAYDLANNVTTRRVDGHLTDPNDPDGAYSGGRTSAFTYDPLDREKTMTVDGRFSKTTWWPSDQLATRTKLNGVEDGSTGEPSASNPGTLERRYYLRSGDISRKVRDPESGSTTTQTYDYDLDGNRLFDERGAHTYNPRQQLVRWDKPSDAQSNPAYATHESDPGPTQRNYAEDPADYPEKGSVDYTLDGTGQTLKSVEESDFPVDLQGGAPDTPSSTPRTSKSTTTYEYEDGYLRSAKTETDIAYPSPPTGFDDGGQDALHPKSRTYFDAYDDLGNVGKIRTEILNQDGSQRRSDPFNAHTPPAPGCPESTVSQWTDAETTYHCFDEFGRMVASQGADPDRPKDSNSPHGDDDAREVSNDDDVREPEPTTSWIYDGLDRRDVGLVKVGGDEKLQERNYIGTSELLSRELDSATPQGGDRSDVDAKTYDYDSRGVRLGQQVAPMGSNTSPTTYSTYDTDAAGSVVGLEDSEGTFDDPDTPAADSDNRYELDPYGNVKDPNPGNAEDDVQDELPEAAADNPFRFEGFYYDSGIQSYDMQAREYRPESGRFVSQDRFEAASADLTLQSDPLTQNRYAFAGGNPVSNIEWDGHDPCGVKRHVCEDGLVVDQGGNPVGTPAADDCDCGYTPHEASEVNTASPSESSPPPRSHTVMAQFSVPPVAGGPADLGPDEAQQIAEGGAMALQAIPASLSDAIGDTTDIINCLGDSETASGGAGLAQCAVPEGVENAEDAIDGLKQCANRGFYSCGSQVAVSVALGEIVRKLPTSTRAAAPSEDAIPLPPMAGGAPVSPYSLTKTESLSGNESVRRVNNYAADMRENGFDPTRPVNVFDYEGSTYIINGHHRVAAAKIAGISEIPIRQLSLEQVVQTTGFLDLHDILSSAASAGPDRLGYRRR